MGKALGLLLFGVILQLLAGYATENKKERWTYVVIIAFAFGVLAAAALGRSVSSSLHGWILFFGIIGFAILSMVGLFVMGFIASQIRDNNPRS